MPLKQYTPLRRLTPMRRRGKKTSAWERERARLKPLFQRAGITACEVRLRGCWRDNALGFAHPRKRRNTPDRELGRVVLSCNICHDGIERWPEDKMRVLVEVIINARTESQKQILGF